jgi:hypothetical protein
MGKVKASKKSNKDKNINSVVEENLEGTRLSRIEDTISCIEEAYSSSNITLTGTSAFTLNPNVYLDKVFEIKGISRISTSNPKIFFTKEKNPASCIYSLLPNTSYIFKCISSFYGDIVYISKDLALCGIMFNNVMSDNSMLITVGSNQVDIEQGTIIGSKIG